MRENPLRLACYLIISFLIVLALLGAVLYFAEIYFDLFNESEQHNILKVHAAAIIALTIFLICVGWLQLNELNKTSRSDFLLRINDRYGSAEIVKARALIQEFYRKAVPPGKVIAEEVWVQKIANEIKKTGQDSTPRACEKFAQLLNLLDFLETIAYFSRKNFIMVDGVDELLGNSLVFYYRIFKPWIYYRRSKYNATYHKELEILVEEILARQLKEKLKKNKIYYFIGGFHV